MRVVTAFKAQGTTDEVATTGNEFWRILGYYSNKTLLVLTVVIAVVNGIVPLLMNTFMGEFATAMSAGANFLEAATKIIHKMIGFACGNVACWALNFGIRSFANPSFITDLRRDCYRAFLEKDVAYYDHTETGILVGRLSQDITIVNEVFIDKVLNVLQNVAQALGGIILALITCWQVALPCTGVICLCGVVYVVGDKLVSKIWIEYNEGASAVSSKAEEAITSFRTIKSFNNEEYESEIFKQNLDDVNKVFDKTSVAQGIKDGLIYLLMHLNQAILVYYGGYLIIKKPYLGYEPGDLLVCLMSMNFATIGISVALSLSDDFKKAEISAAKLLHIMETPPLVDRKKGEKMERVIGKIEFKDVSFKYPGCEQFAVEHLSFTVNPGETVALVGESGCGKSTTLQLLQRFYEITSGEILIDGVNIADLSAVYLRSQISVVPQAPVLFTMSVLDNIKYGKENASDEDVAHAAKVGNAHNFIMELPENYKSRVQQTSLSGGQKQRICISRAILANTPILLLDEATAALDTESEQLVQNSLEEFRKGKTAILVAHRLATVIHADRIFVFSNGRVVEDGTHQELLEKNGMYAELVKFQLQ